ncbi:MAG: PrgI family protein, partial [Pseudonocardiaceae bacterium]
SPSVPLPFWRYLVSTPVRIPADVDMPDRLIGPLTARQVAILAVTGLVLYTVWTLTRTIVPMPAFLVLAIPLGASAAVLALGQREGISLDRMLLAAIRQRITPRHRVAAPEGVHPAPEWLTAQATAATTTSWDGNKRPAAAREARITRSALRLPAEAVTDTGVIDLGSDGLALVAVASTINFALRTSTEQEGLVAGFGRYLHSLAGPVQILIRTHRLDLSAQITELRQGSEGLAHPALQTAALEHAEFLTHLREQNDLLRRQVLLIFREGLRPASAATELGGPSPWTVLGSLARGRHRAEARGERAGARRAAESRLVRRLGDAIELLAPAGITVTALNAGQASAVLAAACNPDTLLAPCGGLAGAEEVITTPASRDLTGHDRHTNWRHDYCAGPDQAVEDDWDYHDEDGTDGWGRYR